MNNTLEYMKKNGVPLTRENYLDYAYLGNPPDELSAEEEAEIPEGLINDSIRGSDAGSEKAGNVGTRIGETEESE